MKSKNNQPQQQAKQVAAPEAPVVTPPPAIVPKAITPITHKGRIGRISVEKSDAGNRFVVSIVTENQTYEYFSTPLSSPDSVRINTQQLRNALPELMAVDNVFLHLLTHRNAFVGMNVEYSVTPQIDKMTKLPKLNPTTGKAYTNVRIEPSSAALTEADAIKLLGLAGLTDAPDAQAKPKEEGVSDDDIQM